MYYNWNEKDELMCDIMCILWTMDNPIVSMAGCIKYFDEQQENMDILKQIWDKWTAAKSNNTLSYSNLHTELIPMLTQDKLKSVRTLFSGSKEKHVTTNIMKKSQMTFYLFIAVNTNFV